MFEKLESIRVSEIVMSLAVPMLEELVNNRGFHISGSQEVFYNCREQGFMLNVRDDYSEEKPLYMKELHVWVCQHRNSDSIDVTIGEDIESDNMFTEEEYKNKEFFKYDEFYKAARYIQEMVEAHYENYEIMLASAKEEAKKEKR